MRTDGPYGGEQRGHVVGHSNPSWWDRLWGGKTITEAGFRAYELLQRFDREAQEQEDAQQYAKSVVEEAQDILASLSS